MQTNNYGFPTYKNHFKQTPMTVLVDMDCVLCDFEGHFLNCYRKTFPDEPFVPLEERCTFYLGDQYKTLGDDLPVNVCFIIPYNGKVIVDYTHIYIELLVRTFILSTNLGL